MATARLSLVACCLSVTTVSVLLLVGCSASATVEKDTPKLSAGKLAATVSEKLAAQTGQPKPEITCPEDLVGKVGATTRCTLTGTDGRALGVTITVSSVQDGQINFDFKADDKASPAG